MLRLKKGDLVHVKQEGLLCTAKPADGDTNLHHKTVYLDKDEHLLAVEPLESVNWTTWHETFFLRLKTNQFVAICVNTDVTHVFRYCFEHNVKDLYSYPMIQILEVIPR